MKNKLILTALIINLKIQFFYLKLVSRQFNLELDANQAILIYPNNRIALNILNSN